MSRLKTAIEFAKNVRTTGAIYQTSKKVEAEISSRFSNGPDLTFVEFGMGHGNITQKILNKISDTSRLYAFEVNAEFCEYVRELIPDKRLIIVNDSAGNLKKHVPTPVNGIASSIPFTLFPMELRKEILSAAYEALKPGAYFSQVMYSKRMLDLMEEQFDSVDIKRFINIPLEFIFHCNKKGLNGHRKS